MDKKELYECDIVQDLLPLYYDDACSPSSRKFVQQHLSTCEKCKKTYKKLENHTIDYIIEKESAGIIERHAKKERTIAYKVGLVIAGLLLLPIVITFLISIVSGDGLATFSVVVASMMLIAALTVIPLISISHQRKLVKSILFGIIALLFIFFFVDRMNGGGEFILWTIPTIFGLSIPLFPFVIRNIDLPPVLSDKKALITMAWDTLWLFFTIFEVCNHYGDIQGLRDGSTITAILMFGVWLVFFTARYLPIKTWVKSGIIVMICSVWMVFSTDAYTFITEHKKQLTILSTNFGNWSTNTNINANVYSLILILGVIISILLITIGIIKVKNKRIFV